MAKSGTTAYRDVNDAGIDSINNWLYYNAARACDLRIEPWIALANKKARKAFPGGLVFLRLTKDATYSGEVAWLNLNEKHFSWMFDIR